MKYGSSLKTGVAFGLMLGLMIIGVRTLSGGEFSDAFATAMVTAVFGGAFMGFYMRAHNRRRSDALDSVGKKLEAEAKLLLCDAAGHYYGDQCVGGRLWLTDKELYFASFPGEMNSHRLGIALSDIDAVHPLKALGIRNGFSVETDGVTERFAVSGSAKWCDAIAKEKGL